MNYFKEEWISLDDVYTFPHYLRNIINIEANEFVDIIHNCSKNEAINIVRSIYSGDAYVLKNALTEEHVETLKHDIYEWSLGIKQEFHQMLDGCPDYHYITDKPCGPEGGYISIEHSYIFYRHNIISKSLNVYSYFDKYWEAIKVLSGNDKDAFVKNIPSDGAIDRISILQYPYNIGQITKHYDSPRNQKLLLGCLLSQIGIDYDYGENGFYVLDHRGRKIYMEHLAKKGDFICVAPSLYHGVPTVTKRNVNDVNWNSMNGRWYAACYTAQSHEVPDRDYSVGIRDEAGFGPIANQYNG